LPDCRLAVNVPPFGSIWQAHRSHDLGAGIVAFFDFAQNEVGFNVPSTAYLILSEVEGRNDADAIFKIDAVPYLSRKAKYETILSIVSPSVDSGQWTRATVILRPGWPWAVTPLPLRNCGTPLAIIRQ